MEARIDSRLGTFEVLEARRVNGFEKPYGPCGCVERLCSSWKACDVRCELRFVEPPVQRKEVQRIQPLYVEAMFARDRGCGLTRP